MRVALAAAALLAFAIPAAARAQADAGSAPDAGPKADAGSLDGGVAQALDAGPAVPPPAPLPPPKPLPPIPAGMGRVAGRLTLNGPAPQPRPAMSVAREPLPGGGIVPGTPPPPLMPPVSNKDIRICGMTQPDLSLKLGIGGGVLDALLWAADGPPPAKGAHPVARVAIEGCRFVPHVLATTAGAELTLVNRDPIYHNVTGSGLEKFSYALVIKDHDLPMRLKKPGLLQLDNKWRAWMRGYVQALPTTASSLTDTDGSYFIDLPPGKHVIKLWHERLGEREETVDIASGETTLKDFSLTPPK